MLQHGSKWCRERRCSPATPPLAAPLLLHLQSSSKSHALAARGACLGVHVQPVIDEGQHKAGVEQDKVGVPPAPPVQLQRLREAGCDGWGRHVLS